MKTGNTLKMGDTVKTSEGAVGYVESMGATLLVRATQTRGGWIRELAYVVPASNVQQIR